jgi:hypothetical protein
MKSTTSPLFDRFLAVDPGTLTGALFLHARSVEDVLIAGGHAPGVGYTALDVIRLAATLMTAPDGADDRFRRWLLPQPERVECHASDEEDSGLPF